jgi:hypothetical protein
VRPSVIQLALLLRVLGISCLAVWQLAFWPAPGLMAAAQHTRLRAGGCTFIDIRVGPCVEAVNIIF